jgi:hypothetical protein
MIPAYLRVRDMGVGIQDVGYEYIGMLLQVVVYFITAAIALYFYARKQEKKTTENPPSPLA